MFLIGGGLMATGCGWVAGSTGPGLLCLSMVSLRLAAPLVLETYRATLLVVNPAKRNISDHSTLLRPWFCSHPSFRPPSNSQTKRPAVLPCRSHIIHPTAHDCPSHTALYITRTLMPPSCHPFPPTLSDCKPHHSKRDDHVRNAKNPSHTHMFSITPYVSVCRHFFELARLRGLARCCATCSLGSDRLLCDSRLSTCDILRALESRTWDRRCGWIVGVCVCFTAQSCCRMHASVLQCVYDRQTPPPYSY